MAGSFPSPSPTLESLTAHDRFLIEKTEEAIREGLELRQRLLRGNLDLFPLDLKKTFRLPNRANGFFGSAEIGGRSLSVMGTWQEVEFGRLPRADASKLLREFVLGEFLKRSDWTHEDGSPGGFTIEKSLYRTVAGEYAQFPPGARRGCIDWRQLGHSYDWVLLTIYINDFVMDLGLFRKRLQEALCAPAHPSFVQVVENPSEEYTLEVSIGYPVVAYAPTPNFFGFGPGKFQIAVKMFSFFLTPENVIRVRMVFAAAPRCQKVFDFGKYWPDPVFGSARLLHYMTLGLWKPQRFYDRLEVEMLAQHCRVHQVLMDGVEKVWRNWVSERDL